MNLSSDNDLQKSLLIGIMSSLELKKPVTQ